MGDIKVIRGAEAIKTKGDVRNISEIFNWWLGVRAVKYENITIIPPT